MPLKIPGFGKFPKSAKPEAYQPIPFPAPFFTALFRIPEYEHKPFPSPFSKSWISAWTSLSGETASWTPKKAVGDNGYAGGSKQSQNRCKVFFASDGYQALKGLAERGCDPNLIMSLFVQYLWDDRDPSYEASDPDLLAHRKDLDAVKCTRNLFENHIWQRTTETELVKNALRQLEDIVQSYIDERDFRGGRHPQNDKQNRVICAMYHHLWHRTKGRQWRLFLDLLVAAGAIAANFSASDQPDRRIMPRIKVFEKEHPKEASLMPYWVKSWPLYSFPRPPSLP